MKNFIYGNPAILATLKTLVETREDVRWTQIAKALENMYGVHISKPCSLRTVYETILNPNNSLTDEQYKIMIKCVIDNWGVLQKAHDDFQHQAKITFEYKKFKNRVQRQFKRALEIGIQVFIWKKSEYKKRLTRVPGSAIERVLKCKTIVQDDPITQNLKRMSEILAQLIQISMQVKDDDITQMYDLVTAKIKKKDFNLLLNAASLMYDLYSIKEGFINSDEQLTPDYWLQPTIEQNKALNVYKYFFGDDKTSKFQMFNQAIDVQQEMDFKLYVNSNPIPQKTSSQFQQKKAKLKTVRGRITLDDKKYPNERTILFEEQEEESDQGFFEFKFGRKQIDN